VSDSQSALFSAVVGVACLLSTIGKPAGLDEALGLLLGAANIAGAVWLLYPTPTDTGGR
jgi:hypothetical protein